MQDEDSFNAITSILLNLSRLQFEISVWNMLLFEMIFEDLKFIEVVLPVFVEKFLRSPRAIEIFQNIEFSESY